MDVQKIVQATLSRNPESLLFVCIGNTCRGPMAEALAKRRWPTCRVMSAGTNVLADSKGAAIEAVTAMRRLGLEIGNHETTAIEEVDAGAFQFVVAMSKSIRRELIEMHSIPEPKIRNLFIDDPIGNDSEQYVRCAGRINKGLASLEFSK